jgi:hypothetical protein
MRAAMLPLSLLLCSCLGAAPFCQAARALSELRRVSVVATLLYVVGGPIVYSWHPDASFVASVGQSRCAVVSL